MSCLTPFKSLFKSKKSTVESTPVAAPEKAKGYLRPSCCEHSNWSSLPAYLDATKSSQSAVPLILDEESLGLEENIDSLDRELRELSMSIHSNPEVGWKEYKTHDTLCDFMEKKGFKVTRHAYGLETAWEAVFEYGKGGRTIGFNSEMDALPGIGHACGHNLIAIAGVGASLAVAANLTKYSIPGKVVLLGTPAEESDGGKINLINAGAYKQMDVCMMLHPGPLSGIASSLAIAECIVEFEGHTAHAAAAPWEGINAQDCAVLAYTNISALRQQIHPSARVHGLIVGDPNWAQNVIPGTSKMIFGVRCPTLKELDLLKPRIENCFHAAALATGCKVTKFEWPMVYWDLRNNPSMSDEYLSYMSGRHSTPFPPIPGDNMGGSTDFGNVSYKLPSMHPMFEIPCSPGSGNHTVGFTKSAATEISHSKTLVATKGIAYVGWKVIRDDNYAKKVKEEFEMA